MALHLRLLVALNPLLLYLLLAARPFLLACGTFLLALGLAPDGFVLALLLARISFLSPPLLLQLRARLLRLRARHGDGALLLVVATPGRGAGRGGAGLHRRGCRRQRGWWQSSHSRGPRLDDAPRLGQRRLGGDTHAIQFIRLYLPAVSVHRPAAAEIFHGHGSHRRRVTLVDVEMVVGDLVVHNDVAVDAGHIARTGAVIRPPRFARGEREPADARARSE